MQFLDHLPEWIGTFLLVIPLVIAGILVTIGIVNKQAGDRSKQRQIDADALADRVQKMQNELTTAQDEKIKRQGDQVKQLSDRLITVEAENGMMKDILKGTDESTKSYRMRVETSLQLVDKLSQVIEMGDTKLNTIIEWRKAQMEEFQKINENIEKLARAIAKKTPVQGDI